MISKIKNWKEREGLVKESVWLAEGIRVYRELLENNPSNIEYKADLAKLLIRSGTDEKLKYVNLIKAKHLFEEVLEHFPENVEGLYRLGHIFYESGDYQKCIEFFKRAIDQPMSEIRMFRIYSTLSKAYFHLSEDKKSQECLEMAIEMDKESNFTSEINEVRELITKKGEYKRLIRYSDGIHQLISTEAAERLLTEPETEEEAILDLSHFHPSFMGPEDVKRLERKEAEILKYLIERENRFVSTEELLHVWEEGEKPEFVTIRANISRLRKKIAKCVPDSSNDIIASRRGQGYRWTCSTETKIIKPI